MSKEQEQIEKLAALQSEVASLKEELQRIQWGIVKVRDELVKGDMDEAYHQLYKIADPEFKALDPWKEFLTSPPVQPVQVAGVTKEVSVREYPHREMCGLCHRVVSVGFFVPDDIWKSIVHHSRVNDIHCLNCFIERADEKLIDWAKDIKFYPVSLRMHLEGEAPKLLQGAVPSELKEPPSDELITDEARKYYPHLGDNTIADQLTIQGRYGFIAGAKWMRSRTGGKEDK